MATKRTAAAAAMAALASCSACSSNCMGQGAAAGAWQLVLTAAAQKRTDLSFGNINAINKVIDRFYWTADTAASMQLQHFSM